MSQAKGIKKNYLKILRDNLSSSGEKSFQLRNLLFCFIPFTEYRINRGDKSKNIDKQEKTNYNI